MSASFGDSHDVEAPGNHREMRWPHEVKTHQILKRPIKISAVISEGGA